MVYYQIVPRENLKKYQIRYKYESRNTDKEGLLEVDARDSTHARFIFNEVLEKRKWRKAKNITINQPSWRY